MKFVAILLLVALSAGIPAGAEATRAKITVNSGGDVSQGQLPNRTPRAHAYPDLRKHYPDPRYQYPDPRLQYPDPRQQTLEPRQRPHGVHHRVAPVVVITQPVYVVAPPSCVAPGYWAYSWVPQSYVASVWVPAHYNDDALWVEAHYEPRAYTWGYYQPYWVPEGTC
ncbi:MAG: hypothetical protein ACRELZ_22350 [Candidatus Rokuibacteriota bacterium]